MILTDTHTHLYADEFETDRDEMMQRALNEGIERMFLPNIDSSSISGMMELTKKYPNNCFPMMGLHPCSVTENVEKEIEFIDEWLSKYQFCAIGEIGIDLYWNKTLFEQQRFAFIHQIKLAKKFELPIVIHARDSFDEIFEIIDELNDEQLKGVFHCFTGTSDQAQKIIDYGGFMLGIGGVVTFKNSGLDQVVADIPLEHILLETDSPYLTPTPNRGKRNETAYLRLIADKISVIKNKPVGKIAQITTNNSKIIFGL